MSDVNPFLALTRTGIHRNIPEVKRQAMVHDFLDIIFTDCHAINMESAKKQLGATEITEIYNSYITDQLNRLTTREKRNLQDFFNASAAIIMRRLNLLEALNSYHVSSDHEFWGTDAESIYARHANMHAQEQCMMEFLGQAARRLYTMFDVVLFHVKAINPDFYSAKLEATESLNYKSQSGNDFASTKRHVLSMALDHCRLNQHTQVKTSERAVSQRKGNWLKTSGKKLLKLTALTAATGALLFIGLNFIPFVGQALALIFAFSIMKSLLITSVFGFSVFGGLSALFGAAHLYSMHRKYMRQPTSELSFTIQRQMQPRAVAESPVQRVTQRDDLVQSNRRTQSAPSRIETAPLANHEGVPVDNDFAADDLLSFKLQ